MATRYIPTESRAFIDKYGHANVFNPSHIGRDGIAGYTEAEWKSIVSKKLREFYFNKMEVSGKSVADADPVVEEATAIPGLKRNVLVPDRDAG